jgi:predicted small metal-binding protein
MTAWRFACRWIGLECEWELQAASREEILSRLKNHARCAHALGELPAELEARTTAALRPV